MAATIFSDHATRRGMSATFALRAITCGRGAAIKQLTFATDDRGMRNKGYPYPLHSLDLLPIGSVPDDEPRFAILVPGGRLVVRPALRVKGQNFATDTCERAIGEALAFHGLDVTGFGKYGMGADWAENLRHWGQRMQDQHTQRLLLDGEGRLSTQQRQTMLDAARKLWGQLSLSSRLAGVQGTITKGPAPGGALDLIDALGQAADRAQARADVLAEHGFDQGDQQRLAQVLEELGPLRKEGLGHGQARRDASDVLVVIRGAIYGDLSRLCRLSGRVLGPQAAQPLQVTRLFPGRRAA